MHKNRPSLAEVSEYPDLHFNVSFRLPGFPVAFAQFVPERTPYSQWRDRSGFTPDSSYQYQLFYIITHGFPEGKYKILRFLVVFFAPCFRAPFALPQRCFAPAFERALGRFDENSRYRKKQIENMPFVAKFH